jgi:hypothetical protein
VRVSDPFQRGWSLPLPVVTQCSSYKLVTVEFPYFGLQGKVENLIQSYQRSLFNASHRQLFCWIDEWFGKTMEDIRAMERETKALLDAKVPYSYLLKSIYTAFDMASLFFSQLSLLTIPCRLQIRRNKFRM